MTMAVDFELPKITYSDMSEQFLTKSSIGNRLFFCGRFLLEKTPSQ